MVTAKGLSAAAVLALGCLLLPACAGVPAGSERVLGFHTDLTVREDGTLLVAERVRLRSAGQKVKRGIFRLFPSSLPDAQGRARPFEFALTGVTRDGEPAAHSFQDAREGRTLIVADPQAPLPPGEHTYTISFTTNRQVEAVGGQNELFWNVIGAYLGPAHRRGLRHRPAAGDRAAEGREGPGLHRRDGRPQGGRRLPHRGGGPRAIPRPAGPRRAGGHDGGAHLAGGNRGRRRLTAPAGVLLDFVRAAVIITRSAGVYAPLLPADHFTLEIVP